MQECNLALISYFVFPLFVSCPVPCRLRQRCSVGVNTWTRSRNARVRFDFNLSATHGIEVVGVLSVLGWDGAIQLRFKLCQQVGCCTA